MAMTINTNVVSINAQRNLGLSGNTLGTTMQRLSSGLRVNSAKDDAAGLAIAERMNAQAKGLAVAARNANDGISLAQTAEGALGKVGDMLQRMRELAVQSSNATNSADDRKALQAEVNQLRSEIDRVAKTTSFNGQKILDGSFAGGVFQVGAGAGDNITVAGITNAKATNLSNVTYGSAEVNVKASAITEFNQDIAAGALQLRVGTGEVVNLGEVKAANSGQERLGQMVAAINAKTADTGVTAFLTAGATADDFTISLRSNSEDGVSLTGFTKATTGMGRTEMTGLNVAQTTTYEALTAGVDSLLGRTGALATATSTTDLALADIQALFTAGTGLIAGFSAGLTASSPQLTSLTGARDALGTAILGLTWQTAAGNATSTATVASVIADASIWRDGTNSGISTPNTSSVAAVKEALQTFKDALAPVAEAQAAANLTALDTPLSNAEAGMKGTDFDGKVTALETALQNAGLLATGETLGIAASADMTEAEFAEAKAKLVADTNYLAQGEFGINAASVKEHVGIEALDISTQAGAWAALTSIDDAIDQVNSARADLGALQTRFEKAIENIDIMNENISAARGRIVDADFASETANLSRAQILQQAGTAMVAQANQLPQQVLSLLQ